MKCSEFQNLERAVYGHTHASLNLSTLHGAGYNYFENNSSNILFGDLADLMLERGYNELYEGVVENLWGWLAHSDPTTCPEINASMNIWTPGTLQWPQINVWAGSPEICQVPIDFGSLDTEIAFCGEHDRTEQPDLEKSGIAKSSLSAYPTITTATFFDETPYDVAAEMSAARSTLIDTLEGDNLIAAEMYRELLEVDMAFMEGDSMAAVVDNIKWQSLKAYKGIFELLMVDSILTLEANENTFEAAAQDYANTLMLFTDSVKSPENYDRQFDLELMKTSLFRSLNKPNIAYSILANMDYCDHDSLNRATLASLMAQVAHDIYAIEQGPYHYLQNGGSFEMDSTLLSNLTFSAVDSSSFGSYIVDPQYVWFSNCTEWVAPKKQKVKTDALSHFKFFPNPATAFMNVEISLDIVPAEFNYEFRLYDMQGKLLLADQIQQPWQQIALPKLPGALYLGAVYSEGLPVYQQKVNIIQ